ncbi:Na-translocating system protein MpsC family protein [Paenibacillus sp. D2_2]|uniref:Na-translocating system protein MpsC family protein n=1 Tax=Paenibacillus sp. D2_2 TaxID=3073092 RepID=UPI00281592EE|nr:Na-translocating system protein MpsC family protein [Paenibacillus sp. D2_2]WMT39262.1 Na-translocating system protein MpsC family protein [Paenibacillus sp. D2_2]
MKGGGDIDSKDFERELAKIASRLRKDFTEKGPVDTRVSVMNNFVILKYIAKFSTSEFFMLEHMKAHLSTVFDEYKQKLSDAMIEDFNPVFANMNMGLKIEEIVTTFFSSDFSEQVTIFKLNKDIEILLKTEKIHLQ